MIRILICTVAALFLANGAIAQEKQTAQQERMKTCNAQASKKDLKGDERQAFMSECLSADAAKKGSAKQTAQQEKMKDCNAQASKKDMKGDERQAFMSKCLSADGGKASAKQTAQQEKMKLQRPGGQEGHEG